MGSSGLLYAAIVAAWAAVLVPRWIRRNEEIERAREEDTSRGVRVLNRGQRHVRAHSGLSGDRGSYERPPPEGEAPASVDGEAPAEPPPPARSSAEARRRRVLGLLLVGVGGTTVGAAMGLVSGGLVAIPVAVLLVFLVLARRAAVVEARRRRRAAARRRALRRRALAAEQYEPRSSKRVAVLDQPVPQPPRDPNAWDPVPVPPPTYLSKPKAEPRVVRKIDLSSPGAWTSGRLDPDNAVAPPSRPAAGSEAPQRRRAVGD